MISRRSVQWSRSVPVQPCFSENTGEGSSLRCRGFAHLRVFFSCGRGEGRRASVACRLLWVAARGAGWVAHRPWQGVR